MTKTYNQLDWIDGSGLNDYVASYALDSSVEIDTIFGHISDSALHRDNTPIVARYVIVDNLEGSGTVSTIYGSYVARVVPYERKTFPLPPDTQTVEIVQTANSGITDVYFTENNAGIPDSLNQLAIQQATAAQLIFKSQLITASRPQDLVADQNAGITCVGLATINYALDHPPNAKPGWFNPTIYNAGPNPVNIVPQAGETINGVWTNATPLQLAPGDNINLFTDGALWYAHGAISWDSGSLSIAAFTHTDVAHTLGIKPLEIHAVLKNVVGQFNYNPGDEIQLAGIISGGNNWGINITSVDASNVHYSVAGAVGVIDKNGNPGLDGPLTAADWSLIIRAKHVF